MVSEGRTWCPVKRELRPCEPGYGAPAVLPSPAGIGCRETSALRPRGGDGKLLTALFGTVLASTGLPLRMRRP